MSIVKRLSTTLFSRIDRVVGEIENHDALAEAAIGEQRKKLAAAKVQLAKIQGHERRTHEQIEQLAAEAADWERRAVAAAPDDEARALACLQRRKLAKEQAARLAAARDEYAATASRLGADIQRAGNELDTLRQKHALLRARQSSNEALTHQGGAGMANLDELASTFERWELRIAQDEILNESVEPVDMLAQQYRDEEEADALRDELQALMNREQDDER